MIFLNYKNEKDKSIDKINQIKITHKKQSQYLNISNRLIFNNIVFQLYCSSLTSIN